MKHYQPTFGDIKPLKLDSSPLKNDGLKTDPVLKRPLFRGKQLPSRPEKRSSKLQPSVCRGRGMFVSGRVTKKLGVASCSMQFRKKFQNLFGGFSPTHLNKYGHVKKYLKPPARYSPNHLEFPYIPYIPSYI